MPNTKVSESGNNGKSKSVAVVFFGVARATSVCIASIRKNIFEHLSSNGYHVYTIASLNDVANINNPRTGEISQPLDSLDPLLLNADMYVTVKQNGPDIQEHLNQAKQHRDIYDNNWISVENAIWALMSLKRAWIALRELTSNSFDYYVFARPDMEYLDPLNIPDIVAGFHGENNIAVPRWHSYGGFNDRIAIADKTAAEIYSSRIDSLIEYSQKYTFHPETFLGHVLASRNTKVCGIDARAKRVRANKSVQYEDFSLSHLHLPSIPNPVIAHRGILHFAHTFGKQSAAAHSGSDSISVGSTEINSYDIFDTVLARRTTTPTDVFDQVELLGYPGFREMRIRAQKNSNHTWSDIYAQYKMLAGISDSEVVELQEKEIQIEKQVCYLIPHVYEQINDGDILVSDMYLPSEIIADLLHHIGFRKRVTIYATPGGKADGSIWPQLKRLHKIRRHAGDHSESDVKSPGNHGIAAKHASYALPTELERFLIGSQANLLANTLREFRLSNPYQDETRESRLYNLQASINLPLLLLLAVRIYRESRDRDVATVLFTMRDSCLIYPLFKVLYPDVRSAPLYTSRTCYLEKRSSFVNYVKSIYSPGRTLIFDLHGAFKTAAPFFLETFGELPNVLIASYANGRGEIFDALSFCYVGDNSVELLNLDIVGPVLDIDGDGLPIRAPISDYDPFIGQMGKVTLQLWLQFSAKFLNRIRAELEHSVAKVPWGSVAQQVSNAVRADSDLSNIASSVHQSLTALANNLKSDKGTEYKCAHGYTHAYEKEFCALNSRSQITLLEIGLNRDGGESIPSLEMWKSYFGRKITLYGMDIDPLFRKFHCPKKRINIITGDQSSTTDLIKCIVANPSGYDVIIDDGYHATVHQQLTLKILWKSLRPGGIFVIEDLHYQPTLERAPLTREVVHAWSTGNWIHSDILDADCVGVMRDEIADIRFYKSLSRRWPDRSLDNALVVIQKR